MSETMGAGGEEDEMEDLKRKRIARAAAAARHAFRNVHMFLSEQAMTG